MDFDNNKGRTIIVDEPKTISLMNKVYLWMFLGLGITALTSWLSVVNNWVESLSSFFIVLIIAELALVFIISGMIRRLSVTTATLLFAIYSILNGLTLSPIFYIYSLGSISTTFFITAGLFGTMAIIGTTTKKDLSSLGRILFIALIGLIISMVVNLFLGNGMLDIVISGIGVVLFTGLTAYDAQKIKQLSQSIDPYDTNTEKVAVLGALTLYLDFINLFLMLLRFFGGRN